MYYSHQQARPRPGFTLVEMLIIVAIIAVVIALGAGALFRWTSTQTIHATEARIQMTDRVLNESWKKIVEVAKKEPPSQAVINLAGGNMPRAQVIHVKLRLMEAFPISYDEIKNFKANVYAAGLLTRPRYNESYVKHLNISIPGKNKVSNDPATESSACLLMALTLFKRGSATTDLDKYVNDTDVDGLKELVDVWGRPLHFFRFATENTRLQASYPVSNTQNDNFRDPLDPQGTLVSRNWDPKIRAQFENFVHKVSLNGDGKAPSFWVLPTIVSGGVDGQTGLEQPHMTVTNTSLETDNIYNFNLQIKGGL